MKAAGSSKITHDNTCSYNFCKSMSIHVLLSCQHSAHNHANGQGISNTSLFIHLYPAVQIFALCTSVNFYSAGEALDIQRQDFKSI